MLYIYSKYAFIGNCPVHEGGVFSSMGTATSKGELLHIIKSNLNREEIKRCVHISNVISPILEDIEITYHASGHIYCGVKVVFEDGEKWELKDNGSGQLVWFKED